MKHKLHADQFQEKRKSKTNWKSYYRKRKSENPTIETKNKSKNIEQPEIEILNTQNLRYENKIKQPKSSNKTHVT